MGSAGSGTDPMMPLPPADGTPATILSIPGAVVERYTVRDVVADAIDAIGPDLVVAAPPNQAYVAGPSVTGLADVPVVDPTRLTSRYFVPGAGIAVVATPSPEELPSAPDDIQLDGVGSDSGSGAEHVCLLTDQLALTVDPHHRTTRLDGIDAYLDALPDGWHAGAPVTHLSTGLRAEYRTAHECGGSVYPVYGAGPPTSTVGAGIDESKQPFIELSLYANGAVDATTHDPSNFGIRGLEAIGRKRAGLLREHGFDSRAAIADAGPHALADLRGFGERTARTVHASATAITAGEVVPRDGGVLPRGDPVFVDIETDGLNGDTVWLIGVLDGGSEDGRYLPFRQRDRDAPAAHIESFMSWLAGPAQGRPVVAWNGRRFDFPIIARQLEQHAPEWTDEWQRRYQFDPLYYASSKNNAALPARSNRLEPVATALGWEPTTTGIDGAAVAAAYNAWRRTADSQDGYQPDWERLEAYCEDDVRALATVYEALQDASRYAPDTGGEPPQSRTTQGSLSDFS